MEPGKNSCTLKGYSGGLISFSFIFEQNFLTIKFLETGKLQSKQQMKTCFSRMELKDLNYQAFIGVTAANRFGTKNDIDILGVQFYNLDERYYQDTDNLAQSNYF
mmetsp:Transcript_38355/g.28246  ORF Transcript_38355/g.28246 Transcript_38355/m.28246 type:complete len:105 (+) Transcript_38355:378-692(+)|eukprot:CAMPEP_0202975766 /NCGR_PEP_ID=MMETSP1396-20130829/71821_1 /ASSEMBLY_ACC=CAM_ASM_000872 /TAXON_ID= /ORGANISM="Pseudokeronopsis sp., Strain Brazil" /LENGTH=104 /DNA_ID=CAMNT_0049711901 /DNA_START=370 /DNA_END=684 /DNA_ORIENTATION=-